MATKWISDSNSVCGESNPICREVQGTHSESHNALTGSPVFKVRLETPWATRSIAISKLLGLPETWPKSTVFSNVVCVSAEVANDQGAYTSDGDGQILDYSHNALIDVTYIPRTGVYRTDYNTQRVYWDDELEPRYESKPENHTLLCWGLTSETVPTNKIALHPDEVPSTYEAGQTLIHTIEGWTLGTNGLEDLIGHVNQDAYISPILNQTFAAGTLLFRNFTSPRSFSFRSYRCPIDPPPEDPNLERSGKSTLTLKCIFEHKKIGWEKFRRLDVENNVNDYYYIRYNRDPFAKFVPFTAQDMRVILG